MSTKFLYSMLLLLVTFFWGVTFPLIKQSLYYISPLPFLAIRFAISTLLFVPLVIRKRALFERRNVITGIIAGTYLAGGYVFQTIGLLYTSAAASGMITGLYVIILPILSVVYLKIRLTRTVGLSSILAFVGLIVMSYGSFYSGSLAWFGDILTLVCALGYAFQLAYLSKYSPKADSYVLSFYQLLVTAILTSVLIPFYPHEAFVFNGYVIFSIVFTAIFAGILAIYVMTRAMIYVEPSLAGIIFVGEPIFAAISSVILIGEKLAFSTIVGGIIMVAAIFIVTYEKHLEEKRGTNTPQA